MQRVGRDWMTLGVWRTSTPGLMLGVVVGVLGIGGGGVGGGWGWQVLTGWACLRVCNGEQRRDEDVQ